MEFMRGYYHFAGIDLICELYSPVMVYAIIGCPVIVYTSGGISPGFDRLDFTRGKSYLVAAVYG